MPESLFVGLVLVGSLVLFIWERWRYDVVAMVALLTLTLTGIIPAVDAFAGFSHPAVITVAGVLVITRAMVNSGVVDVLARWLLRVGARPGAQVVAITLLTALCSAVMNNVAAVALLMPVGIHVARRYHFSPSRLLMPMAYASLLGGMTTLIGTPPNIIIALLRTQAGRPSFGMFDFSPVGVGVAAAGIVVMLLFSRWLLPDRKRQLTSEEMFHISDYLTEVRLLPKSKWVGKQLREIPPLANGDVIVAGIIRNEQRSLAPSGLIYLEAGDILIVQADAATIKEMVDGDNLELVGSKGLDERILRSNEVGLVEAVVTPGSPMVLRTVRDLDLRRRFGINLLAVARQGADLHNRLGDVHFAAGDVVLLQGPNESLTEALPGLGCLPLAGRNLRLGQPRRLWFTTSVFAGAIVAATAGLVPIEVAIATAATILVIFGLVPLRELYTSIEWPVIVLLGAMIPVADALETTGGTTWIAEQFYGLAGQSSAVLALAVVLAAAMILTPLLNNAAAALLIAPLAISIAHRFGVSPDPFLMATAVGVSCDFLTPIGHQSNTLVMGPGGYRFGDYWRLGLPVEIIVYIVTIPLVLFFWPL
ncbi:MAG: SLC13 family permease [Chloroflexi bacterium]|nr:MAG: SLC13 family permease [Chloroflexota bacterium]